METISTSPQVEPFPQTKIISFAEAMDALLDGKKVRRQEWPDDGTYLVMRDEKVMIFKLEDKRLHPLTISSGDILGTDWVVIIKNS